MKRLAALCLAAALPVALFADHHQEQQYLEFRTYHLSSAAEMAAADAYFKDALLPALERQGIGPVGVWTEKAPEGAPSIYVLIPFDSMEQFAQMQSKLDADAPYQSAAADFFNTPQKQPRYTRVDTELLLSFKAFPRAQTPPQKKAGKPRLFELRSYESPSEKMAALKVEMFNAGEVPVFLDCGIQPVFMGRVLAGPKMPNLTYMTVYDDEEHLADAWKKFGPHPGWQKLRAIKKYEGTVSKIHKTQLTPRPYSGF